MKNDGKEDTMNELKIEYIPLANLTPYEKNARLHTEADLATIRHSIEEFGMCDPIGIWSEKNVVVEGHGRMLALKALGHKEAPCIRLDHLSDEQRRAYALAHNKTAEMSKWDFEMLDSEIAELDLDMTEFGFVDVDDIDWAGVDDINEENYDKPVKDMLECPECGHRASKMLFKKVAGEEDE